MGEESHAQGWNQWPENRQEEGTCLSRLLQRPQVEPLSHMGTVQHRSRVLSSHCAHTLMSAMVQWALLLIRSLPARSPMRLWAGTLPIDLEKAKEGVREGGSLHN